MRWEEVWMSFAKTIANKSYDSRLKVGAIVVASDNTQVLSLGYNGNYTGGPNVEESLEPGCSGFIHAEANAIIKLDFNFHKEKHMYLTHSPCRMCSKMIINAQIKRVIYDQAYRDTSGLLLLEESGIFVSSFKDVCDISNTR